MKDTLTTMEIAPEEAMSLTPYEEEEEEVVMLGFWVYLLSDALLFAALFATYAVLHGNTFGGPSAKDLFSLPYVLAETLLLLTSSFTIGLGALAAHRGRLRQVAVWFSLTLLLGVAFLVLEVREFVEFSVQGYTPHVSGFLSAYFTLVGTHGAHVGIGILWIVFMLIELYRAKLSARNVRRLTMLSLFWHFLDVIWIAIFTIVYLFPFI